MQQLLSIALETMSLKQLHDIRAPTQILLEAARRTLQQVSCHTGLVRYDVKEGTMRGLPTSLPELFGIRVSITGSGVPNCLDP